MRSGPPSETSTHEDSVPSTLDPLEEAVGLAIQVVGYQNAADAYRNRAARLAVTVAEVLWRGNLREQLLRLLYRWRQECVRGRWV